MEKHSDLIYTEIKQGKSPLPAVEIILFQKAITERRPYMKKSLSALLLSILLALSIAGGVFAASYNFNSARITPPKGYVSKKDSGMIACARVINGQEEVLMYVKGNKNSKIKANAEKLEKGLRKEGYSQFQKTRKVTCAGGRTAYYFGGHTVSDGIPAYVLAVLVPGVDRYTIIIDLLHSEKQSKYPFTEKDAKKLANTVKVK